MGYLIFLFQIPLPQNFALERTEAEQVALVSHCVDLATVDDGSRSRTSPRFVRECPIRIGNFIRMRPDYVASRFIEAVDTFLGFGGR